MNCAVRSAKILEKKSCAFACTESCPNLNNTLRIRFGESFQEQNYMEDSQKQALEYLQWTTAGKHT